MLVPPTSIRFPVAGIPGSDRDEMRPPSYMPGPRYSRLNCSWRAASFGGPSQWVVPAVIQTTLLAIAISCGTSCPVTRTAQPRSASRTRAMATASASLGVIPAKGSSASRQRGRRIRAIESAARFVEIPSCALPASLRTERQSQPDPGLNRPLREGYPGAR